MEGKTSEMVDMEDEEVCFEHSSDNPDEAEFDMIVGCLEELVMDDSFQSLMTGYYKKHCGQFEAGSENKLEYMEIFTNFTNMVESSIDDYLSTKLPGFTMKKFETLMVSKQDALAGDVFDLLMSLGDFKEFKENMIAHKAKAGGRAGESKLDFEADGKEMEVCDNALGLAVDGHNL